MKMKKAITAVLSLCLTVTGAPFPQVSAAESEAAPQLFAASEREMRAAADSRLEQDYAEVGELPEAVDLRAEGLTPAVRDQGSYGTCWAHALTACLEIAQTPREPLVDYSEWYTSYYTFRGPSGTNLWIPEDEYDVFSIGGSNLVALPVFANWVGPVREADYPYGGEIPSLDRTIPEMQAESLTHVTEYHNYSMYANDMDDRMAAVLKKAICDGHAIDFSMTSKYLRTSAMSGKNAYFEPENADTVLADELFDAEVNSHAMVLVGYDDNYPIENFTYPPKHKGAWLVRNSWGTNFGDNGYFWLSYDQMLSDICYLESEPAASREFIFSHDTFGGCGGFALNPAGDQSVYAANEFTPEADTTITDVMLDFFEAGDACEITVYTDLQNPDDPTSGTPSAVTEYRPEHTSYQTVPLAAPVTVEAGKPFAVVVKYSGNTGFHISCEYGYHWESSSGTIQCPTVSRTITEEMIKRDFHPQESFVSADGGQWFDLYTTQSTDDSYTPVVTGNVCIKAIGVSAGAVIFSDYHDTIPAGTQISLTATDGEPIYYAVNGGEFEPYSEPIEYTGGEMTVSAYTQEGNITSRSYSQQQAGLTSLLLTNGIDGRYADLASDSENTYVISSYDSEAENAVILPIGRGTIRINGEVVPSGSKYPVDAKTVTYQIEISAENLLPQSYQIKVMSEDTMPIPEGIWVGIWYDRSLPEQFNGKLPEGEDYPCENIPIAVEFFDGKGVVRNLRTGETEPMICRQDEEGGCEIEFRGQTVLCSRYLSYDSSESSGIGSHLYVCSKDWEENRSDGCLDSAALRYVSQETMGTFKIYTDAEILNAMQNYYAEEKGITPTKAKIGEDMNSDYAEVFLYNGENLLETYSVNRCGDFYSEEGEPVDYGAYLTEAQPIEYPAEASVQMTGDCNNDGEISVDDAQLVLTGYVKGIVNNGKTGLTAAQTKACDIDGDGAITAADAQFILIYYTENTVTGKQVTWDTILSR